MPAVEFERYARWRVRGELVDELRRSVFEARRNFGREHKVPRRTETGAVEMARDMGLLPRIAYEENANGDWHATTLTLVSSDPSPEEAADMLETLGVAHGAIEALPERARDMLMRRLAGEQDRDIGAVHGLSGARVNQIIWEAVRQMHGALRPA